MLRRSGLNQAGATKPNPPAAPRVGMKSNSLGMALLAPHKSGGSFGSRTFYNGDVIGGVVQFAEGKEIRFEVNWSYSAVYNW